MGCSPGRHLFAPCPCVAESEYDAATGEMTPEAYAAHAERWVTEQGASIVGGCCGVGPRHMRALAQSLAFRRLECTEAT